MSAINGRNISIEYEKLNNESLTPAQIQAGGRLMAYWHDQDEQPWEQHPFVPKYGIVCSFLHWEFGTTDCGMDMEGDLAAIQAVSNGIQMLDAGFTIVRDMGNFWNFADAALRQAIEQGWIPGPTIINSFRRSAFGNSVIRGGGT